MIIDEGYIFHIGLRRTMESYCKAGGFTSRSFIIEAVSGKSCRILVIYLTKSRKKNSWVFVSYLVLCIDFRV